MRTSLEASNVDGSNASDELIRRCLEQDLKSDYRNADAYLCKIEIRLIYKDITVEMLHDESSGRRPRKRCFT